MAQQHGTTAAPMGACHVCSPGSSNGQHLLDIFLLRLPAASVNAVEAASGDCSRGSIWGRGRGVLLYRRGQGIVLHRASCCIQLRAGHSTLL